VEISKSVIERVLTVVFSSNSKCIPLSDVVPDDVDVDSLARELMKIKNLVVYYNIPEDEYYVCRRDSCSRRLTVQDIVDELKSRYDGELVPKPEILDFLKERAPAKYEAIYNMLLNDGVLEEVNISGMVFVRIVK